MSVDEKKRAVPSGWAEQDALPELRSELLEINMGPQHPATHGVLRLLIKTDGEIVYEVKPCIGYLHRCAEKIAEGCDYKQWAVYTDRFDYLAPMNCNLAYAVAVERLMPDLEIPLRAEYIRVVCAELQRIASHLIALGTFGLDMGAWTPLLYCFREREEILNLFERLCGGRMLYNYICVGGVRFDLPDRWKEDALEFIRWFEKNKIDDYNTLLSYNKIFIERTADVGIITPQDAHAYACTGPVLRGSGIQWDCRRNDPYSVYDRFEFEVPIGTGELGTVGDCWDRYMVRVREMQQSCRIIRQALESIPDGLHLAELKKVMRVGPGAAYTRTESAKGELGFYIIADGGVKPFRNKVRSPSYSNLHVIEKIGPGLMISDLVATVGSLDIVLGEIDR
jgi:NADH-quinone oxidoreductase subunit D